ncbi:MAG TPA: glycosyltransferase family 39 protein [Solirubrobacteraceae bacterium]|jgi:4-amino-4-deoxy-L-arabinose transferase-like glycosyltransferase|nr:glycosyltransferase family 39 protein [Solirubrobacteraceae bacterium]
MSTPQISVPTRAPSELDRLVSRARSSLRRLARGHEADPAWARPLLWLVAVLAGTLIFWGLTRNGYANTYYAEAAQAASHSWKAWLTNAVDTSGSDSLDKGPLSNMLMGLSGRLFGFSTFTMLAPEALCGVGAVLLLHNTVRRTVGHRAAILAALMLALTPIFVAMSRFNNPDALLVLLEVAAAWALVRALQSGRTREVLLCGLFVGLAFNVKMLQAYLIVPGLAMTLLAAGQGTIRRRLEQLLAGGAAMFFVSFVWYATMMLIPAADRPWVGDTTDDSWFSLIFGANGLSRVSGEGTVTGARGGGVFGGASGPLRLFNSIVGGQIAWLLPLALVGLLLGLWTYRRAPRTDLHRPAYLLWGGWALVSWMVFSFSQGLFHPYYTTALAPAVAVLAAGAVVALWDRARDSAMWALALAAALIGTAALGAVLLDRASGFVPLLAPVVMATAVLGACALLLARLVPVLGSAPIRDRVALGAALAGLLAILAGPTAYSLATVGKRLSGGNPLAGPASAEPGVGAGAAGGGFPGGVFGGGIGLRAARSSAPPGLRHPGVGIPGGGVPVGAPPPGPAAGAGSPPSLFGSGSNTGSPPRARGSFGFGTGTGASMGVGAGFRPGAGAGLGAGAGPGVSKALVAYLKAHQGKAAYLVAAVGSGTAGSIAVESGREAIDMGGFMGSDPAPSLAKLKGFIDSGQLHYVLLDSGGSSGIVGSRAGGVSGDAAGARGGAGVGGPGVDTSAASRAAIGERDEWIEKHGTVVHVSGESSSAGGMTLYYFAGSS